MAMLCGFRNLKFPAKNNLPLVWLEQWTPRQEHRNMKTPNSCLVFITRKCHLFQDLALRIWNHLNLLYIARKILPGKRMCLKQKHRIYSKSRSSMVSAEPMYLNFVAPKLRWLEIVSSTYILKGRYNHSFITWYYNHGIKKTAQSLVNSLLSFSWHNRLP